MKHPRSPAILFVVLSLSSAATSWADPLVISEFMARNDDVSADQDGDFPDWIEVFNTSDVPVSLSGWSLTDDAETLDRWQFPAATIEPRAFLVVFASGKDRADPESELHTNFKLSGGGEYLALVDPGGRIVAEFAPEYDRQVPYASYGINMGSDSSTLIEVGAVAHYHVPTDDALGLSWTERDFDASGWASGPSGIGFDQNRTPLYTELIMTDIGTEMRRVNASVYIRLPFNVDDPTSLGALLLQARYEDGMVVWVNGVEVARINLDDDELTWDARAARSRPSDDALSGEQINISAGLSALQAGTNILAIQGLNSRSSNADFLMLPRLEGVTVGEVQPGMKQYFSRPSPGLPNTDGVAGIAEDPVFSRSSGAFTEAFALELTSGAAEIRFTLTPTGEVTQSSTLYEGTISVDSTMVVRARSFHDGLLPSQTVEMSFVGFEADMLDVSSNLPIVVINTFGTRISGKCDRLSSPARIMIIEPGDDGRARITDEPQYIGSIGLRARGASTCGREKSSMNIEFRDESHDDLDVEVLGFASDSDFILYGAYNFDHSLFRNAFIYEISNQVGRWAPRSRPVEVYLNQRSGGQAVTSRNYWGVYTFMEKIKRGPDRVDIANLDTAHDSEPEISGGYIFKIDRNQENEPSISAPGAGEVVIEYPKDVTPRQLAWLRGYLTTMDRALRRPDPLELGREFIDVDSWIDHHILMMFPKNVDAFRLSGYFHKDREGKLRRGPIWDYDRTMGSTDGRDRRPELWRNESWDNGDAGTHYFLHDWYGLLFKGAAVDEAGPPPLGNDEWAVRYRARWRELREGPLSTENLLGVINSMAEEIGEAADRDWQRWRQGSSDYSVPINHLKQWISRRVAWIDSQLVDPPAYSEEGGFKTTPFELEITALLGDIYYTINGPDPRLTNGLPHPDAVKYTGPISVDRNTRVWARARLSESWSQARVVGFYFELAPIVITEIMYNPAGGTNHEFLEFLNVGDEAVDLTGVRLRDVRSRGGDRTAFDFTDSDVTTLGPGEYVVAVNDVAEFTALYGEGVRIAGELQRSLSNTRMTLKLLGPVDEPLLEVGYDDDWEPTTDGDGYSLVARDPLGPRDAWVEPSSWRASLEVGGSPGRADGAPQSGSQLPGDLNQDNTLNVSDAIGMLRSLFLGRATLPCASTPGNEKLLDMNGDAAVNLSDVVHTLEYLYRAGQPPALGVDCVPIEGCPPACE